MNKTQLPRIPPETASAARAIFGRNNFYLVIGDHIDELFAGLIPYNPPDYFKGSKQTVPIFWMVTIFQYLESIPDQQAADAIRKRIDWKYALHLPFDYPGLGAESFCEFRKWMLVEPTGLRNLQVVLARLSEVIDLNGKSSPRQDPQQVIIAVCQNSRLAKIWETLNRALEALAIKNPDWLLTTSLPHWYKRYGHNQKSINLRVDDLEKITLALAIGADGEYLQKAISQASDLALTKLPEILELRRVWDDQFEYIEGKLAWRENYCAGCSFSGISAHPSAQETYNL